MTTDAAAETTRRTTMSEVRDLAAVPVWSADEPNAAGLLGLGRSHAYALAQRGELPTLRLGKKVLCPTGRLLALLEETA